MGAVGKQGQPPYAYRSPRYTRRGAANAQAPCQQLYEYDSQQPRQLGIGRLPHAQAQEQPPEFTRSAERAPGNLRQDSAGADQDAVGQASRYSAIHKGYLHRDAFLAAGRKARSNGFNDEDYV